LKLFSGLQANVNYLLGERRIAKSKKKKPLPTLPNPNPQHDEQTAEEQTVGKREETHEEAPEATPATRVDVYGLGAVMMFLMKDDLPLASRIYDSLYKETDTRRYFGTFLLESEENKLKSCSPSQYVDLMLFCWRKPGLRIQVAAFPKWVEAIWTTLEKVENKTHDLVDVAQAARERDIAKFTSESYAIGKVLLTSGHFREAVNIFIEYRKYFLDGKTMKPEKDDNHLLYLCRALEGCLKSQSSTCAELQRMKDEYDQLWLVWRRKNGPGSAPIPEYLQALWEQSQE
jgi:hypothetical protein